MKNREQKGTETKNSMKVDGDPSYDTLERDEIINWRRTTSGLMWSSFEFGVGCRLE